MGALPVLPRCSLGIESREQAVHGCHQLDQSPVSLKTCGDAAHHMTHFNWLILRIIHGSMDLDLQKWIDFGMVYVQHTAIVPFNEDLPTWEASGLLQHGFGSPHWSSLIKNNSQNGKTHMLCYVVCPKLYLVLSKVIQGCKLITHCCQMDHRMGYLWCNSRAIFAGSHHGQWIKRVLIEIEWSTIISSWSVTYFLWFIQSHQLGV